MNIRDFSRIRLGHSFREGLVNDPDGKVLVIQPKDISVSGTISFNGGKPLTMDVTSPKFLRPKDVLVVNRGRFAAAVFELSDEKKWIVPSSIIVLTLKDTSIIPEYLACYLNSANGQKMFQRHFEQTTIPFISTKNLGHMDVPIPPLARQQALVALAQATEQYNRLSCRKQEMYRQFVDYALLPKKKTPRRSTP